MQCSRCFIPILIAYGIAILAKLSDAKAITNDENENESDENACQSPYHVLTDDGRCVWSCGTGTTPDSVGEECVCQSGYYENGKDGLGRRVCIICPSPYHVLTDDGRCVWSCGTGTTPDSVGEECICQSGYYETGKDGFGRRICTICPRPYHVLVDDGRCVWSCGTGTQPDSVTNECVCQSGYYETSKDKFGRRVCAICRKPYHVLVDNGRCVWSCGTGTTPDTVGNECVCQNGYYETGTKDKLGRRICSASP